MPALIPGRPFLCDMPGRHTPFTDAEEEIVRNRIDRIVCLTPHDEIELLVMALF